MSCIDLNLTPEQLLVTGTEILHVSLFEEDLE